MESLATRVVLLGASNLTMALSTVLGAARSRLGPGPLAAFVAAGHGRSYGRWSRVAFRGLPAILECGLWAAATRGSVGPTYALVTDVGNDLAYGASPAELAGWVGTCLDRLDALGAAIVLTLLPVRSLARLRPWQYQALKALLFPGRRLPFRTLQARVAETNERLSALAVPRGVTLVEPDARWYGADAIHIRWRQRGAAWQAILSRWPAPDSAPAPGPALDARLRLRGVAPEHRTVLGIPLRRLQPTGRLGDGSPVWLF